MFKYFSPSDDINNVFTYIKSFDNKPKVIISDINFIKNISETNILKNVINDPITIDFFIIDTHKNIINMQDDLFNIVDIIYTQDITNSSFFMNNNIPINKINNIIEIKNPEDKNNFLYNIINDDFYIKSFDTPIVFFLLFSSISTLIDFMCKFNKFNNIYFILKPIEIYNIDKILIFQKFIEVLLS